jgi:hypothetical protein
MAESFSIPKYRKEGEQQRERGFALLELCKDLWLITALQCRGHHLLFGNDKTEDPREES